VLASDGPYENEIWGDLERMLLALKRYGPNRVVARLTEGTDLVALNERIKNDREVPAKVMTERDYLTSQTRILGRVLLVLGLVLSAVMGAGAVFTAINTMLSAVAARTHEIGILLATGFRPWPVFFSFLFESVVLGLLGGAVGCLLAWPLNGIETSGMNWNTFTDVAFAFRITPAVLAQAVAFSLALGLIGGAWPAWRAARMTPTQALRRH
jgi:putative ABC transport system permease protein